MKVASSGPAIHLHIERLVVRGPTHVDRAAVSAALQERLRSELRRMPSLHSVALPRAQAALSLPAHGGAQDLGGALAKALVDIIGRAGGTWPASDGISQGQGDGNG